MPAEDPALIAVIGPVDPALFAAWVSHYRSLGVRRFQVGFRFPANVSSERRAALQAASRALSLAPAAICCGTWNEHVDTELRDALRAKAGPGWHLLAGAQEFHQFPTPLPEVMAGAQRAGSPVVGGVLLDRVTPDGRVAAVQPQDDLDRTFPLGGHLTHRLLGGDPRRVVLARSDVAVTPGNHEVLGSRSYSGMAAAVHHFAWHADAMDTLRRSVPSAGAGAEHARDDGDETVLLLGLVAKLSGRIDVADVRLRFRHVSLTEMPHGWQDEARRVAAGRRTRAAHGTGR